MQMARFGGDLHIDKKGTIDLVTEVDLAVERMFRDADRRALSRSCRSSAEELGGGAGVAAGPVLGVRSDRRHDQLRARPADLLRLAGARDRRRRRGRRGLRSEPQGAVHGRARRRRLPERPAAARVVGGRRSSTRCSSPAFPTTSTTRVEEIVGLFGAFVGQARAVRRLGSAAIDLCYVAAGRMDGFWESDLKPWDIAGGALIVAEAGGRVTNMDGDAVHVARRPRARQQRTPARGDARRDPSSSVKARAPQRTV